MRLKSRLLPLIPRFGLVATLLAGVPHVLLLSALAQDPPDAASGTEPESPEINLPSIAYEVTLPETGDEALNEAIRRASALEQLRERAPVDAFGLVSRALAATENMRDAMRSEGYYSGTSRITVAGETPDTPGLAERLEQWRGPGPVPVVVSVEPGPRYSLATVRVQAEPPGTPLGAAGDTGLEIGSPARAEPILEAESRMTTALLDSGHPFATIRRRVTVDPDTDRMEVTFFVHPGPRAEFAVPSVTGEKRTSSELLAEVVRPLAGQVYSPEALAETRRNLLGLGVFSTVRSRAADRLNAEGLLPVTFTVLERPLHAVGFSAAYETRYGPTFSTYWEHRNLFGGAERLRLEAELNRLGTTGDINETGGKIGASLRTPWFAGRNQTLTFDIAGVRERLDAYDRDAFTLSALLDRTISPRLSFGFGPQVEFSRVTQDDVTTNYQLFGVLGQARWSDVDDRLNPSQGVRAALLVNPTYSLSNSSSFTRIRAQASTYFDLSGSQSTILALRGVVGSIVGGSYGQVPPDKRFYAGGGGSVRGYDYQSIGPRTADNEPAGGLSLVEGSVELRQRVSGPWGMAAFIDAGSVTTDVTPEFRDMKVGVGLGLRYLTAIGPLRADVAVPLDKEPGNSAFGLYIGIGQAF